MNQGINLCKVTFSYNSSLPVLNNINFTIKNGTFLGITGLNGSGKTTLINLFNGIIPHLVNGHLEGNVFVDGVNTQEKPVSFFARKIGMVFQNPDFSLFNLSVEEEIAFGLKNFHIPNQTQRINQALNMVDLNGFAKRDPQTLSFGEKQRVNLACILSLDPAYLVLDEPSSMLDYKGSINLYEILKSLNKKGKSVIVVEHDTDLLKTYAKEIIILDKGKVVSSGLINAVFSNHKLLKNIGIKIPQ